MFGRQMSRCAGWSAMYVLLPVAIAVAQAVPKARPAPAPQPFNVRFVDASAPAGGDGTRWSRAYQDLQDALDEARSDTQVRQIWVADGVYFPDDGSGDRTVSFELVDGVSLYGGFAGGETSLNQRDPQVNLTILSGDLSDNDGPNFTNYSENSQHVVTGSDLVGVVFDGFVVERGNANFNGDLLIGGGGMFVRSSGGLGGRSDITVRNCVFRANSAGRTFVELGNFGGGLHLAGTDAVIQACVFEDNRGNNGGALGLYARNEAGIDVDMTVTITDTVFARNDVPTQSGGAIWSTIGAAVTSDHVGTLTVQRCTFEENHAGYWGAWLDNNATFFLVEDCVFRGNTADVAGGALGHIQTGGIDQDPVRIEGCLFEGNEVDGDGGGVWLGQADGIVRDCIFRSNVATFGGSGLRAGTYFTKMGTQDIELTNCLFENNSGSFALEIGDAPTAQVINCTIVNNTDPINAVAGVFSDADFIEVENCILFGNAASGGQNQTAQLQHFGGVLLVNHSLVQGLTGSLGGTGNVDADPLFVDELGPDGLPGTGDEDFRLLSGSPAIDAGNNAAVPLEVTRDLTPAPRFADDPDAADCPHAPGTCGSAPIVDVGAYERQP